MRRWTKTTGLLFFVIASVYYGQSTIADEATGVTAADSAGDSKLVVDADSAGNVPAEAATLTASAAVQNAGAPATQPTGGMRGGGPKVSVSESGTFSIQINNDISVVELLRMIGNQAQLSIVPSREVRGTVPPMDLYNVTVYEALDAILHSNGMVWKQRGNVVYVLTEKEEQDDEKAGRARSVQIFHLYYTDAANALSVIKPVLSPDAVVSSTAPTINGIASNSDDAGGDNYAGENVIVVTDYPENLQQVARVIREIDHRPQQILVEATIFQATLTDNNALGIDFSLLGGINFDTLLGNSTSLMTALSSNILNAASGGTAGTGAANVVSQGYSGFTTGAYDTQVPPGGLQIGVVHNNLGVFIQALEQVTDATILANPKVLALDKQRGEVIVGNQYGYLTTTTTSTTTTQTVQFLETGTRLIFRPFVGDDGYIRMEIHPEDSSGGLNSSNLPFKLTTEITSNVEVKDGNTIVIGGLFREASQSNRSQVPILGNLPLAGALFRNKTDDTQRQEIIILLTPHIIKDDSAYAKVSEEEMQDAEKIRVGVRKGMMWFGRERLAETAYENAVAELSKPVPDVQRALWHLDCATNLNPQFLEAINLKEKLTEKRVTDVDNSSIRSFLTREIMAETPEGRLQSNAIPDAPPFVGHTAVAGASGELSARKPLAYSKPTTAPSAVMGPPALPTLLDSSENVEVLQALVGKNGAGLPATRPDGANAAVKASGEAKTEADDGVTTDDK
jgi:type IV pilus assembly protein PilQ